MQPTAHNHTPPRSDAPVQTSLYVCIYEPCAHFAGKASTGEEAIFTTYDELLKWAKGPDDEIIVQIIGVSLSTNQSADLTEKVAEDIRQSMPRWDWPDWVWKLDNLDPPTPGQIEDMQAYDHGQDLRDRAYYHAQVL